MVDLKLSQRLDQRVVELIPEISRGFASHLIAGGMVKVNGALMQKPSHKLHDDDTVEVDYDATKQVPIADVQLEVIYEDEDVVVVNKPAGILSHSKGGFNPEPTVATWLRSRLSAGLAGERAGIVHRLDRATSGVMICAKTPEALTWLQKQFSLRKVKKTYAAVVSGSMPHNHALIDIPISRNAKKPQTFHTNDTGKPAQTEYRVLKQDHLRTLLELKPKTGRTHQLRVHLSAIGHPIVGDTFYGGAEANRLYLHAAQLEVTLPNRHRRIFDVPTPKAFREMVRP